jgi:DNA-binding MarR family transcriptional regulator
MDQFYGRAISSMEITVIEWYILRALYEADGQHPYQLADRVGRAATSFTPLLDKLEHKDLIRRHPDPLDRRAVLIYLTDDGKALRRRVQASADEIERRIKQVATDDEWRSFERILSRLATTKEEPAASRG